MNRIALVMLLISWTAFAMLAGAVVHAAYFWPNPDTRLVRIVHEFPIPVIPVAKEECRRICDARDRMEAVLKKESAK